MIEAIGLVFRRLEAGGTQLLADVRTRSLLFGAFNFEKVFAIAWPLLFFVHL